MALFATNLFIQSIPMNISRNTIWVTMGKNINQDTNIPLFIVFLHSSFIIVYVTKKGHADFISKQLPKSKVFFKFDPCDCQSHPHVVAKNVYHSSNNIPFFFFLKNAGIKFQNGYLDSRT